jgi:hypothetical protein
VPRTLEDAAEDARVVASHKLAAGGAARRTAKGDAVGVGDLGLEAQGDFWVHAPLDQREDGRGTGIVRRRGAQHMQGAIVDDRVAAIAQAERMLGLAKRKLSGLQPLDRLHCRLHSATPTHTRRTSAPHEHTRTHKHSGAQRRRAHIQHEHRARERYKHTGRQKGHGRASAATSCMYTQGHDTRTAATRHDNYC